MEKIIKTMTVSLLGLSSALCAAKTQDNCCMTPPAPCYQDGCTCCYCLGPEKVNPSVRPKTCNGDWTVTAAGFYWNSHQDGMEYAVEDNVFVPSNPITDPQQPLNNLIDAEYKNPNFKWDFGFKVGLGYNTTHDGWDISALWTWYQGRASTHVEAEADDNHSLITLWSAFSSLQGDITHATDIETHWKLGLNLLDLELGREYWVSKYLTFRPHIGLRISWIEQDWKIEHKGGSWAESSGEPLQDPFNNEVSLRNDFKGVGVRGGFNTVWNFGRGWALFGNTALSIVYGRFDVKHDEWNRLARSSHDKTRILETEDRFRASRAMTDIALGLQWSTMFSQCRYGFTIGLAWEHHMFFDQNQMWRVVRLCDIGTTISPNLFGENTFYQRRGDLDTQGWTLTLQFAF